MNIIEAVKSGRRIRRAIWGNDYGWFNFKNEYLQMGDDDILADDWTVEPLTITREKFDKAWQIAMAEPRNYAQLYLDIVKELGL